MEGQWFFILLSFVLKYEITDMKNVAICTCTIMPKKCYIVCLLGLVFRKTGLAIVAKIELFSEAMECFHFFFFLHIFIVFRTENESVSYD